MLHIPFCCSHFQSKIVPVVNCFFASCKFDKPSSSHAQTGGHTHINPYTHLLFIHMKGYIYIYIYVQLFVKFGALDIYQYISIYRVRCGKGSTRKFASRVMWINM